MLHFQLQLADVHFLPQQSIVLLVARPQIWLVLLQQQFVMPFFPNESVLLHALLPLLLLIVLLPPLPFAGLVFVPPAIEQLLLQLVSSWHSLLHGFVSHLALQQYVQHPLPVLIFLPLVWL